MREIDILLRSKKHPATHCRCFGLHASEIGYQVQQGDDIDSIGNIDALDEELHQSDRYMEVEAAHA